MEPLFGAAINNVVQEEDDVEEQRPRRFDDDERDPFGDLTDVQFKQYFRLTKELARTVIEMVRPYMPQRAARRLTIEKRVLIALAFFASGSYQGVTGINNYLCVSQPTVSCCLHEVCDALNQPQIFNEVVSFPRNRNELHELRNRFFNKFNFPGIVGCIDCTHVAIIGPKMNNAEYPEHVYVNRKGYHSINVQLICDENLRILNVNARFPGSAHDARIWRQSGVSNVMEQVYRNQPEDPLFLIGDSGYPLRPWLLTPILNADQNTPEDRFNNTFKRIRSTIERCNGVLKSRFRCLLKHRVLHYDPTTASKIINACVVLHNMCIENNVADEELNVEELDFGVYDVPVAPEVIHNNNPDLQSARALRAHIVENYFN